MKLWPFQTRVIGRGRERTPVPGGTIIPPQYRARDFVDYKITNHWIKSEKIVRRYLN